MLASTDSPSTGGLHRAAQPATPHHSWLRAARRTRRPKRGFPIPKKAKGDEICAEQGQIPLIYRADWVKFFCFFTNAKSPNIQKYFFQFQVKHNNF
jgi:hypothetical protein